MSIELEHSFEVPIPPDQAWDVLLDVQRVAPCMPGATVEAVDGDEVSGKIKVKVGPIALTYTGKATFTERDDAAHSVKIEAAGKETRGAGTASAVVLTRLKEENGQTRVEVHTTLNVTGRPAQFGRGVMAEVSGKIIEKFSANLAGQLAGAGQPEAAASDRQVPDSRMAIPIQELNLSARSVNTLKGEGIDTVGQLASRTESELLSIRNLGQKSVGEIEQRLGDLGLSLAGQAEAGRAAPAGAEQRAVASAASAMATGAMAASPPAAGATADGATSDDATAGSATPSGTTADRATPSGTTAGSATPRGTAAGSATPSGTAADRATPSGTAAGSATPRGTTAGSATPRGTAAGSATPSGTAAGSATPSGATPGGVTADSAAWDGPRPATWTGDEDAGPRRDEPEDGALNLFDVASGPILKRALPAAAVTVLLIWVGTRIRRIRLRGQGRRAASP